VEDAKAFMKMMLAYFHNCSQLEQVEVFVELAPSIKTSMHKVLGANLSLTNTVYHFIPLAPLTSNANVATTSTTIYTIK